jgi:hypothetical protein
MECMVGMGVPLFLRGALDDAAPAVTIVALDAVDALLCCSPDEEASLDARDSFTFGRHLPPLCPLPTTTAADDDEDGSEGGARTSQGVQDIEHCRRDLVGGMLHMRLLPRLSFLLTDGDVQRDEGAMRSALNILIRVARHSLSSASAIVACSGLLTAIFDLFVNPAVLLAPTRPDAEGAAGIAIRRSCTPLALKLVRVLSSSGRGVARDAVGSGRMGRVSPYVVDSLCA